MHRGRLAWAGTLLVGGGVAVFLAGAFVLTNNARHGRISPAVYIGIGMVVVGLVAFAGAGVNWFLARRAKSLLEDVVADLEKEYPLLKYVDGFGPLHWKDWLRAVDREPAVRGELQTLIDKVEAEPRWDAKMPVYQEIVDCIRRHPTLHRRVGMEYKIQLAHILRQGLFRSVAHPDLKSAEWRTIFERLEPILARRGSTGHHLVDDEVGEPGHKIELSDPELLTPELLKEIGGTLRGLKNDWYVIVQLDFDQAHPDALPGMLTVWANHVDEAWDKEQLRSVLGARFRM